MILPGPSGAPVPESSNPESSNPEPVSTEPVSTESFSDEHANLDQLETLDVVRALANDQARAVNAVLEAAPAIARAADLAVERLQRGGRLIYAGAGTSGRLSFLDAAELTPTFSWPRDRALVLIAGGNGAIVQAVEGAEDHFEQGKLDAGALNITANDSVIGIAASGNTPYVLGVLEVARTAGALTIGISCNPGTKVLEASDVPIAIVTGAEVISGSTRLKAGTAQKITLNSLSSTIMVKLHKVHGNLMVDVQATNIKLVDRAVRLTQRVTGANEHDARLALASSDWQVKTASLMLLRGLDARDAKQQLDDLQGNLRRALEFSSESGV
jgi:N-acetylmuramic acid 6-phosphate etherase